MFIIITIFIFLLGLSLGSFLHAWIFRTRMGTSIANGRSHCLHCNHVLSWADLIPVVSFLVLKGKCRHCQKNIGLHYLLVEFVTGILFVFVFLHLGSPVLMIRNFFIVFFLEFIFIYDLRYGEIPWKSTLAPAFIVLFFSLIFHWNTPLNIFFGIIVGAGFFLLQFFVSKGTWVGGGDIGMGFFMGGILGWPRILLALFLAYVGGAVLLLPFLAFKKVTKKSKIAFGTFLSVACFFAMMWGDKILSILPL